jgi:CubicO group peptidase (beta-lactamase class C family)
MMFTRRSLLRTLALTPVVVSALAARGAQPISSTPRITPKLIQEIETLAEKELSTFDIVGAAPALIQDGEVVYAKGFGVRDLETGEPFDADTVHRIGSTTKSMTSMLTAIQVEQGLFAGTAPSGRSVISTVFRKPN